MTPPRVPIPSAAEAERSVAAIAAESAQGAWLAAGRVDPGDFREPAAGRVFAATVEHRDRLADLGRDDRLEAVAQLAGVDLVAIDEWRADAPVALDRNGRLARQVRAAADRRRIMTACAAAHEHAGHGDLVVMREALAAVDRAVADLDRLDAEQAQLRGGGRGAA